MRRWCWSTFCGSDASREKRRRCGQSQPSARQKNQISQKMSPSKDLPVWSESLKILQWRTPWGIRRRSGGESPRRCLELAKSFFLKKPRQHYDARADLEHQWGSGADGDGKQNGKRKKNVQGKKMFWKRNRKTKEKWKI